MKAFEILEKWAHSRRKASAPALIAPDGTCLRTWGDIDAESLELAPHLTGSTSPVALQLGNHPAFPAALLACWRAGRPVCLIDASLKNLDSLTNSIGPGTRISSENNRLKIDPLPSPRERSDSACVFKLTSGTTSLPAPIAFTSHQILADCDNVCAGMGIGPSDLNFGVIAFTHSYGFSNLITPLLCRGIPLVVADDALPRAIQKTLVQTRATVLPLVPAMFRALCSVDSLPPSLRLCISAGAPLETSVAREFHAKFARKIHSFYGASESGGICYDASDDPLTEPGFVGAPLPGVEITLVDPQAPTSRIRVRSRAVGSLDSTTPASFEPCDLLAPGPRGFRIVGRVSDIINCGGKKVAPAELERVIARCPGVREVIVFGSRQEKIHALVVGDETLDRQTLRRHCAVSLPPWQVPREFHLVPQIPLTPRGKISRLELAASFS